MEQLRTAFFLGMLTALLLGLGYLIGGPNALIPAFIFAIILNGFSYFFSDKIVLWMSRAQPLPPHSSHGARVHRIVGAVAQRMQIPIRPLYMIEERSPNAFATGRNPEHAAVVFTRGILELLNDEELEGVIAHELSHVKNRDVLVASLAAVIAGSIGLLAHMMLWSSDNRDRNGSIVGVIIISIAIPIIATLIQLAISRSREFLADESAAHTLHSGSGLASALGKLEKGIHAVPFSSANSGTAHLFIANPFGQVGIISLFATHPPISVRIERLKKMHAH